MNVSRTKAGRSRGSFEVVSNFPLVNREELMLLRDPSRYKGNQAWRVHSARKSAGWFIRGTSSGSVSLEKQLFPFKLRRIASTLGCVSRGRLAFLWTRSSVVYSILVAWSQKRRLPLQQISRIIVVQTWCFEWNWPLVDETVRIMRSFQ